MKQTMRTGIVVTLSFLTILSSAARAHHGVTGLYDTSQPILIAGTVTEATFSPPHPVISVMVEAAEPPEGDVGRPDEFTGPIQLRADDVGQVREVEFSPVATFYDLRDRIRVGDRVVIVALQNCEPEQQLRSSYIALSDGEVISYTAGLHRKVDGCS
jgi:Family of unknown function (DUF6152)